MTCDLSHIRAKIDKRSVNVQDLLRHTAGLVYGQIDDKLVHQAYRDAKVCDRNAKRGTFSIARRCAISSRASA